MISESEQSFTIKLPVNLQFDLTEIIMNAYVTQNGRE